MWRIGRWVRGGWTRVDLRPGLWGACLVLVVLPVLAHGPGRAMKAEARPCPELTRDAAGVVVLTSPPGGGGVPFCLEVVNREREGVHFTLDAVTGEVMGTGVAVCVTGRRDGMAEGIRFEGEGGVLSPVFERSLASGETFRVRGVVEAFAAGGGDARGCLRVRLAPAREEEGHAGHVKNALFLLPLRLLSSP